MSIHKQKKALANKIQEAQKLSPLEKVKINRMIRREEESQLRVGNKVLPVGNGAGINSNF